MFQRFPDPTLGWPHISPSVTLCKPSVPRGRPHSFTWRLQVTHRAARSLPAFDHSRPPSTGDSFTSR